MGTKYSSNSISGYNSSPPADDGTVSEANRVKYSTIKTKITDPIKTLVETVDSELATHFDNGPTAISTATTLGASHYNQVIEASGTSEITLTDAATLGAGWFCDIINKGAGTIPILRATASDTIDGTSADTSIISGESIRYIVNAGADGFLSHANNIPLDGSVSTSKLADSSVTAAKTTGMQNVIQLVYTQDGTYAGHTTVIPADNTIPQQSTEGSLAMSQTITPTDASNILEIQVHAEISVSGAVNVCGALFRDSTEDALAACLSYNTTGGANRAIDIVHRVVAGSTSSTTFKFHLGPSSTATVYFNGSAGAQQLGGVMASFISVKEYKA